MKVLKFNHELAQQIARGERTSTWRINDEKNITVDDEVVAVDKVDRSDESSWLRIGKLRINEVMQKRLGEVDDADMTEHDYATKTEMLRTMQGYYGHEINESTPVKILRFSFSPEKPIPYKVLASSADSQVPEIKLYADGGSRGNPGPSASGYVLMDMNDAVLVEGGLYLGITTNNQAEYRALKMGLEDAQKRGVETVHVYMDSLLVINQMKGTYKIKNRDLIPVYQDIKSLAGSFKHIDFNHVPREYNKLADAMVNEVLDSEPIDSR